MNKLTKETENIVEAARGKGAVIASLSIHAYIQELRLAITNPDAEISDEEIKTMASYITGLDAAEAIIDAAITTNGVACA